MNEAYELLQEYAMGGKAKFILGRILAKYLSEKMALYICSDFTHELMTEKAEALLEAREKKGEE
jgi:hypothetical protein